MHIVLVDFPTMGECGKLLHIRFIVVASMGVDKDKSEQRESMCIFCFKKRITFETKTAKYGAVKFN